MGNDNRPRWAPTERRTRLGGAFPLTVAELAGHSGTQVISRVYSHLSDRASHLREAQLKIHPEA